MQTKTLIAALASYQAFCVFASAEWWASASIWAFNSALFTYAFVTEE